jgi:D-amino-acid dehydrogenase
VRVVVIGCGLAGLTTAYYLRRQGADVTVVDRAPGPARETSYANGSMITPSLADPWNAPGVLSALLKSLGNEESSMLLRMKALPSLLGWGLRFLRNSTPARYEKSFLTNVRFACYSQHVMRDLLQRHTLQFDYVSDGTVQVFSDAPSFKRGREVASWLRQTGLNHRSLTPEDLIELEPALEPVIERFTGAIHYPDDEVGNARRFCEALGEVAADEGVELRFSEMLISVERSRRRIVSVTTARERLVADAYVLAAGSFSWPLAKEFGIRVPVRPAKGYSITVPLGSTPVKPRYPVVDDACHAAVVPLGRDQLRVAGTAEFTGFDTAVSPQRIANLEKLLARVYPRVECPSGQVEAWCGFRPMTPDGRPIIGRSAVDNLFLNTGHGALGWTLACGSGQGLADLITGSAPGHDLAPFSPNRF